MSMKPGVTVKPSASNSRLPLVYLPDFGDDACIDGKVTRNGFSAQAVHEVASSYDEFVRHGYPPP